MRAVRFHPNASEELEAVVAYYEGRRPGLGAGSMMDIPIAGAIGASVFENC